MEFESGSELEPADGLRQAQIAGRWKSPSPMAWAWLGWSTGWRRAKRAVMQAEMAVHDFAVSWEDAWARAEVRAWTEAKARPTMPTPDIAEVEMWATAGALLLGEAWGGARAQARGEPVPDGLADPQTIADILTHLNHSGLTRYLWYTVDISIMHTVRRRQILCIIRFYALLETGCFI